MTAVVTGAAALASGKDHAQENFPVGSRLIAARHRPAVMAFYRFARAADDIADHPTATEAEKLAQLGAMRDTLLGASDREPTAVALRDMLATRGLDRTHALDLLDAFTRDVTICRYATWDDLIDYCRLSAMPVGRFMLDVHGEGRQAWLASDALCAALQIINHLQDCARDHAALDRVYLPQAMLAAAGARTEDLAAPQASPALRRVIADAAAKTEALLAQSAGFARAIADRRLSMEVAVIQRLAVSLAARLRTRDPLSERVHHGKGEALVLAGTALLRRAIGR